MLLNTKEHWEKIYSTKTAAEMSWFQPYPASPMQFLELFNLPLDANIIDIGGGDSHFVDALLEKGYQNIWMLDISANAIERAKKRLGPLAERVHWIVSDVRAFQPPVTFRFWHDRAALHFLTTEEKIAKYVSIAASSIQKDGSLLLGTVSEEGPDKCSGLDIQKYSESSMSGRFEADFKKIKCVQEDHITPFEIKQNFLFCSFQKK